MIPAAAHPDWHFLLLNNTNRAENISLWWLNLTQTFIRWLGPNLNPVKHFSSACKTAGLVPSNQALVHFAKKTINHSNPIQLTYLRVSKHNYVESVLCVSPVKNIVLQLFSFFLWRFISSCMSLCICTRARACVCVYFQYHNQELVCVYKQIYHSNRVYL